MNVAHETPTFIYRNSLARPHRVHRRDRQPPTRRRYEKAIVPRRAAGAGGWFSSPSGGSTTSAYFNSLSLEEQNLFGRTKSDSTRLDKQVPTSAPRRAAGGGETADATKPKREMVRRSTPYAFHDSTVGLYFMGFCKEQAPMRECTG